MTDAERSKEMDLGRYGIAKCVRECRGRYEYGDKKELVY